MVPDKIKGVNPSATLIYIITGSKIKKTGLCIVYWKNVTLAGKHCESENLSVIHSNWIPPAKSHVAAETLDYTNLWPILKPIGSQRIVCMLSAMHLEGRKRVPY